MRLQDWAPWKVMLLGIAAGFVLFNLAVLWSIVLWRVLVPFLLRLMP